MLRASRLIAAATASIVVVSARTLPTARVCIRAPAEPSAASVSSLTLNGAGAEARSIRLLLAKVLLGASAELSVRLGPASESRLLAPSLVGSTAKQTHLRL